MKKIIALICAVTVGISLYASQGKKRVLEAEVPERTKRLRITLPSRENKDAHVASPQRREILNLPFVKPLNIVNTKILNIISDYMIEPPAVKAIVLGDKGSREKLRPLSAGANGNAIGVHTRITKQMREPDLVTSTIISTSFLPCPSPPMVYQFTSRIGAIPVPIAVTGDAQGIVYYLDRYNQIHELITHPSGLTTERTLWTHGPFKPTIVGYHLKIKGDTLVCTGNGIQSTMNIKTREFHHSHDPAFLATPQEDFVTVSDGSSITQSHSQNGHLLLTKKYDTLEVCRALKEGIHYALNDRAIGESQHLPPLKLY